MNEHEISFPFKARYYKLGEINSSTKQIWFVLHGYGQLAQCFIKKFKALPEKSICVIAPEGLSRFYLEELQVGGRKNNRVGATWMTKENRLMDIENYIHYLDGIFKREVSNSNLPITVLGFSQGSATATRWVLNGQVNFNRLILWSGIFPPDMDFQLGSQLLRNKAVYLVYGTRDPFLTDSRFEEMKMLTKKLNTEVKEVTFEGEHNIEESTLQRLLQ